jgi:hypothetical protein
VYVFSEISQPLGSTSADPVRESIGESAVAHYLG